MFSPFIFWPWFTGLVFLAAGVYFVRRELATARALEKLVVLGPVFFGASLATFGAEHLAGARFIMQGVPPWMPARLFWAYFVGCALIATAISFVISRYVALSAAMVGTMIFLFVLMLHVPRVVANPRDRISWAVALRDLAFASSAWALAGSKLRAQGRPKASVLILIGRFTIAIAVIFFGVEHFLHPTFAPGVPLAKLTPPWVPAPALWAYMTGAVLFFGGIALLINRRARFAAIWIGLVMTLLTFLLYLPILATAKQPSDINEGTNYVADTLLFAGTVLLLARAISWDASPSTSRDKRQA